MLSMTDFPEIFRRVLLDHYRHPRGMVRLEQPTHRAFGRNRTCGDEVEVELCLGPDGCITEFGYVVRGCSITTATASMLSEVLPGLDRSGVSRLTRSLENQLEGELDSEGEAGSLPGQLSVLAGLRGVPARHACARVVWETVGRAMESI